MDEVNHSPEATSEVCCKDEPGDPPSGAGRLECHVSFPMAANVYVPPPVRDGLYLKILSPQANTVTY